MPIAGTTFEVWICPECLGCFASPGTQGKDLSKEFNHDLKQNKTFTRDVCQICTDGTKLVRRERYIAVIQRKMETVPPPMTEAEYYAWIEEQRRKAGQ